MAKSLQTRWLKCTLPSCGKGRLDGALTLAPGVEFAHFTWDNCAGDRSVTLDIHTGGHFIPTGWLGYQLDGLMPKTPG